MVALTISIYWNRNGILPKHDKTDSADLTGIRLVHKCEGKTWSRAGSSICFLTSQHYQNNTMLISAIYQQQGSFVEMVNYYPRRELLRNALIKRWDNQFTEIYCDHLEPPNQHDSDSNWPQAVCIFLVSRLCLTFSAHNSDSWHLPNYKSLSIVLLTNGGL